MEKAQESKKATVNDLGYTLASKKVYVSTEERLEILTTPETEEIDLRELLLIAKNMEIEDVSIEDIEKIEKDGRFFFSLVIGAQIVGTGYNPDIYENVIPVENFL